MQEFKTDIQQALQDKIIEVDNRLNAHDNVSQASVEKVKHIEEFISQEHQDRINEREDLLSNQ